MSDLSALDGLRVGIIGCGNMGSAMVKGLTAQPDHPEVILFDVDADRQSELATATGAVSAETVDDIAQQADLVVLAVKPTVTAKVLEKIRWPQLPRIGLSIAAGTQLAVLRPLAPRSVALVRAMPNMPATIGAGISAVLRHRDAAVHARVCALLSACGQVVSLEREELFDAVTALSGSGPAYVFVAIEALADAGVHEGLPRDIAMLLATQTVLGSARLVVETGIHPAELKDAVASPGGTTIHGLAALERAGFRGALFEAVRAAAKRSREIAEE
jgi:pyrroline-5-carboxylate reductase